MLTSMRLMPAFTIYIHLPFCVTRCRYCDFYSVQTDRVPYLSYRRAVLLEKEQRGGLFEQLRPVSLYIGGGTPSLWPSEELSPLLEGFEIREDWEVTVEVNPGDGDRNWFRSLVGAGVNRFSVGVQALEDSRLRWMGRRHDGRQAIRAIELARESGARSVSADIIYGTPGQRSRGLVQELETLIDLGVDHVSAYELTAATGTPLGNEVETGRVRLPDDTEMVGLWQVLGDTLENRGFERYEVSSYGRPGFHSRHNEHYWSGGAYMGLGAGAHGFVIAGTGKKTRYANVESVGDYMAAVVGCPATGGGTPEGPGGTGEVIDDITYARERMMLGLRTVRGVPLREVWSLLPVDIQQKWRRLIGQMEGEGMVEQAAGWLIPTTQGMLYADELAEKFF